VFGLVHHRDEPGPVVTIDPEAKSTDDNEVTVKLVGVRLGLEI